MVLSRGNTLDYAEMYRAWAGHDPQIEPYLEYYGLTGGASAAAAPAPAAIAPAPVPMPAPAPAAPPRKKGERGS
jgi:peptidyl-dipeptidase Dcp